MGFYDTPALYVYQIYSEELQKFRLAAEGFGQIQPPEHLRERVRTSFTSLPEWYAPLEGSMVSESDYPIYALTQRPMAMYHSWGSQNPWLRQIHGHNPLFVSSEIAKQHQLSDGDWVWVASHHGRIKVQVVVMHALNPNTVWTWNAIGKRKGTWQLNPDAPEATKGFLLNHLIHELLPEKGDGLRWANADPITGQAAWYDLKVSITKTDQNDPGVYPDFPVIESPGELVKPASTVTYGIQFQPTKGDRS